MLFTYAFFTSVLNVVINAILDKVICIFSLITIEQLREKDSKLRKNSNQNLKVKEKIQSKFQLKWML